MIIFCATRVEHQKHCPTELIKILNVKMILQNDTSKRTEKQNLPET